MKTKDIIQKPVGVHSQCIECSRYSKFYSTLKRRITEKEYEHFIEQSDVVVFRQL